MKSVFEKLLDNLIIAALVPSLAFFTTIVILFEDIVPSSVAEKLRLIFETRPIFIVTMAICLSFILSYLSESIYFIYRGKIFPKHWDFTEKHNAQKFIDEINRLTTEEIEPFITANDLHNIRLKKATIERNELIKKYNETYPLIDDVLPTRFGNILAAAEQYPDLQYKIPGSQMWVRLKHVIPTKNMEQIDRVNHEMAFLINSSLLLFVLAFCSWVSFLYQYLLSTISTLSSLFFSSSIVISYIGTQSVGFYAYLIFGIVFVVLALLFYKLSIPIAKRYAELYRCAFDLFRFNILEQLRLECPATTMDEPSDWLYITGFLTPDSNFIRRSPEETGTRPYKHPNNDTKIIVRE